MHLAWNNERKVIVMTFASGDVLEWPGTAWSRAGKHVTEDMFEPINDWFATRQAEDIDRFEQQYRKIYARFTEKAIEPQTFTTEMRKLVRPLFKMVDWDMFKTWCLISGGLHTENGKKDSLDEKDRAGITYFTEEYIDLMCFSVLLKLIMPIWGIYHKELDKIIGKDHLHMKAVDIIMVPELTRLSPWKKLDDYVHHFAELRITKEGFSLTKGIGKDEIPDYLFALALIKKVVIYNVRSKDRSIVTDVYHTLNERCRDVNKPGVNQKRWVDERKGDEISIVDQYKIIGRIPPGVSVLTQHFLDNMKEAVASIDPSIPKNAVLEMRRRMPPDLDPMDYHVTISGLVLNDVLGARSLMLVNEQQFFNAIAIAATILEHKGYKELALLLTTKPMTRDIYEINFSDMTGRTFTSLPKDVIEQLQEIYPFQSQGSNPGMAFIEKTVKVISRYEWAVDYEPFNDIRLALARLLIHVANEPFKNNHNVEKGVV